MKDDELLRYSRQIMLPDIEIEGQERLGRSHIAIIGLGGLGSPAALYLGAAGVGELTLVDFDEVELSNLQRQIAHGTPDIGRPKVQSAQDAVLHLNPNVRLNCINARLDEREMADLASQVDLVVDGTDNFETRFAVNRACVSARTPLVSGAAIQLEGQLMVYDPAVPDCPCYQCLYQDAGDAQLNCAENGVAAPVVGAIGTLQALEAIKLIAGFGQSLAGYLLVFDARTMDWRKLKLPRNPQCKACGPEAV